MAGQHENAGADDGADPQGYEAGRRQGALEWNAAMGGQGLNIPFFRLRAQCSDRLPGPEIRHGNGPSKAGRARRASSRHPFAMRRNLFSFDQLSPVFRWPRQASADPLAENARFGLSVGRSGRI